MLNALELQLRNLARDSYKQFTDEVSGRVKGKPTDEQLAALKEFIFLLPATLRQLSKYWNRKDTPPDAKRVSGFLMTYVYEPNDFLSETRHGLFGFLDDSYLVMQAYLKIQDRFLRDWHQKSFEELELIKRAEKLIVAPQMLIPAITSRIDKIVDALMAGDNAEVERIMANRNG